jgi:hypothetical protein
MIAFAALLRAFEGQSSPLDGDIDPNLPLVSTAPVEQIPGSAHLD